MRIATPALSVLILSTSLIGCLTGSLTGCRSGTDSEDTDPAVFRYDAKAGICKNGSGTVGLNPYQLAVIQDSKNAECVDLSGVDLILLEKSKVAFSNDSLIGWNFKGAFFFNASLHFNHIVKAQLEGADMSQVDFGYAFTNGKVDKFTKPPTPSCNIVGGMMSCDQ